MASSSPPASSLGLAIVGCGQIVTHHLDAMSKVFAKGEDIIVRALCDPTEDRRRIISSLPCVQDGFQQPREFESLEELMSDNEFYDNQIDIIFIAVPHDLHESIAQRALLSGKGKFVVMEKPLAPTVEQCDNLVTISREVSLARNCANNNMLIIAEQSPYWEEVSMARDLIQSGKIGRIVSASSYYYESMRDNVTSGGTEECGGLGWRGSMKRAGGGIAIDGGLHWIRPLREMLGGRITDVFGVVRPNLAPELKMEGEALGHALFKIDTPPNDSNNRTDDTNPMVQPPDSGPLVATYSCNMLATAPMAHNACPYFRVTGTKGEIIVHGTGLDKEVPGAGGLRLYDEKHPKGAEQFPNDRVGAFFRGFGGLWKEIRRICLDRDVKAAHESVVRASDDVKVVMALYASSKSGQWEST